jgi:hypothetical protein
MSFDRVLTIPFQNGGIVKVIIGSVLGIIPIINFFSFGYILECFENGAKKREAMPEWTDWGAKFINGFLMCIIGFIYMLIPLLVINSTGLTGNVPNPRYHMGFGTILFTMFIFMIFTFILPMAVSHFAVIKNFGAAFQLGYILKLVGSSLGSYIGAYLLYFVAVIICILLNMIPIIGWILVFFTGFYLGCVSGFLFGSVYNKAIYAVSGSSVSQSIGQGPPAGSA